MATTYYRFYEAVRDDDDVILGLVYTDKFFEDQTAAEVVVGTGKYGHLDTDESVTIS